jgi:uncharacterized protein YhhL (DUF1145 family)
VPNLVVLLFVSVFLISDSSQLGQTSAMQGLKLLTAHAKRLRDGLQLGSSSQQAMDDYKMLSVALRLLVLMHLLAMVNYDGMALLGRSRDSPKLGVRMRQVAQPQAAVVGVYSTFWVVCHAIFLIIFLLPADLWPEDCRKAVLDIDIPAFILSVAYA